MKEKNHCPTCEIDCPYWRLGGFCTIENPMENCEDYYLYYDDYDDYDYNDYDE